MFVPEAYVVPFSKIKLPPIETSKLLALKSPEVRLRSLRTIKGVFNFTIEELLIRLIIKLFIEALVKME